MLSPSCNNWPSYNHDICNSRNSVGEQLLNRCNVSNLDVVWRVGFPQVPTHPNVEASVQVDVNGRTITIINREVYVPYISYL